MLVDINLLPQRETKNKSNYILTGVFILLFLVGTTVFFSIYSSSKSNSNVLENELNTLRQMVALEQQKISEFDASSSVVELENAVLWAESYPTKTVPLLNHIIRLLPERGFLRTFSYAVDGTISITVQFDTNREVAYYLKSLTDSKLLLEVTLLGIQTEAISNEDVNTNTSYLPRYIAQFNLKINKQAINELQKGD